MKKVKLSVSLKIGAVIAVIVGIILTSSVVISYNFNKDVVVEENLSKLNLLVDYHEQIIQNAFDEMDQDLKLVQEYDLVRTFVKKIDKGQLDSSSRYEERKFLSQRLLSKIEEYHDYEDIIITDVEGKKYFQQSDLSIEKSFFRHHLNVRVAKFYNDKLIIEGSNAYTYASRPLFEEDSLIGIIVCKVDLIKLLQEKTHVSHYFKGASLSYGFKKQQEVTTITLKSDKDVLPEIERIRIQDQPIYMASKQISGQGFYGDHVGAEKLTVFRPLTLVNIGISAQVPKSSIFHGLQDHFNELLLESVLLILITFALTYLLIKNVRAGLNPIRKALRKLNRGAFPESIDVKSDDEFSRIGHFLNQHVDRLKESAEFAHEIGNGKLDNSAYNPISDDDTLGQELIRMQENLREQDEKDNNRNWIVTGLAELGGVLREFQNIDDLGDGVVEYLYKRIGAVNGKLYLHNPDKKRLDIQSAIAFDRKKHVEYSVELAVKNIVTDTFKERQETFVKEIPDNYYFIKSGLKEDPGPKSILVVPLLMDDEIFGVLDFCSYIEFTKNEVDFIVQVSQIITRTIFNIRINDRTRNLLEQSQQLSKELEQQVEEVNNAQNRIQILLENASEVITIYDENHLVKYSSPSIERILGYHYEDFLDKRDIDLVHPDHKDRVNEMFQKLKSSTEAVIVEQFIFRKKDGTEVWVEATGKNMLNDPAIHGIVINKRDITERRLAEEEQRKRGQMQALSENSLDLITRIDADGSFFYINPTIEALTGHKPNQYLNKKLDQVGLNQEVAEIWSHILDTVISSQEKKSCEMEFPSEEGEAKIMMVNAIPEFDAEEKDVESVLLVSHDITESKKKENVIKAKNKKINDSINYAERIQSTILPGNEVLRELLPKSFMIFKPRDLVSGDFPWIFQHGDDIILAAVDCTGHGVPGAMISLVGYFLLNEVVVGKGIYQPGEILDELDKLVTDTFRQNSENAKIKDGMDVAICRFNPNTGKLDYAGAHRPLYLMRTTGEEVEQLKGDKFPIGGGSAFKNKTNFMNFEADLNKGDAFYFFSDGLPDQFGGPQDRKLGPKRIRKFIEDNKGKDMFEMEKEMDNFLLDWQGEQRQFDDILIFGVEY